MRPLSTGNGARVAEERAFGLVSSSVHANLATGDSQPGSKLGTRPSTEREWAFQILNELSKAKTNTQTPKVFITTQNHQWEDETAEEPHQQWKLRR